MLRQAVQGISDLITVPGLINLDFADVKSIMQGMGMALMGAGRARGENRAIEATQQAISSPLLEEATIQGAKGVLINITGGPDLTLYEVNVASTIIREAADEDANIIFGAVIDENLTRRNEDHCDCDWLWRGSSSDCLGSGELRAMPATRAALCAAPGR